MQCMQISVSQSMHACMLGSISRARAARPPRIARTARIIMQLHEQMHIAAGALHACMQAIIMHAWLLAPLHATPAWSHRCPMQQRYRGPCSAAAARAGPS